MYKVVYKYANGKKGTCTEGGKAILFDTERGAAEYTADLNSRTESDILRR